MNINDLKYATLQLYLGRKEHIDDMEYDLLTFLVTEQVNEEQINDLWMEYLDSKGFGDETLNDGLYNFFVSLGFPKLHIDDMWVLFWEYLTANPPEGRPYEFEMATDIEPYEFDENDIYLVETFVFTNAITI